MSNKNQVSSLYQMATKDSSLAHGMIWGLLHFGWTWGGLFVSDDMKEEQFLWNLKVEMVKKDICVDFTEKLPAIKRTYEKTDVTPMSRISFIHKCAHNVS